MTEAINEAFVEREIERLQATYREVPVDTDTVPVAGEEFPEHVQNARDGYVGGAYAWVTRRPEQAGGPSESYAGDVEDRERALLILPRGESAWGIPGGGLEGEESFAEAARREVVEEAGIECEITGLWHLRHLRWGSEDVTDDRVTHSLHVFFDAEYAGGTIAVQQGEVNGAAWFAELPNRLMDSIEPRAQAFRTTD